MKLRRQLAILEIINSERISTQDELCAALKERGFEVTQATVSRDIKELKLVKIASPEGYHYAVADSQVPRANLERMNRLFKDAVLAVDDSENLVVVKTLPGTAHAVASTIDLSGIDGIVGTVAGDDTIIVVVKPRDKVADIVARFKGIMFG